MALTSRWTQVIRGALFLGALGLGYFLLAKVGLALAFVHPSASPVWPPSGLALASYLLWGNRVWPAIASGAFFAGAMTCGSIATSLAIAMGNTLEGLVTASLVRRWCTREEPFATPARVVVYSGLTLAPGTVISATLGVGSLVLAGYADPSKFRDIWFTWWLGDVGGQLVVAPIIVLWADTDVFAFGRDQLSRMARLMVATIAVGLVAFSPLIEQTPRRGVFAFLAIGPLLWAALRYCQRDTATVAFVLSSFAIWGTLANSGPFAAANMNDSFLLMLMFVFSTAVPSLVLSADVSVRRQVQMRKALLVRKLKYRIKTVLAARKDLAETLEALRLSEARSRTQAKQLRALSDELTTTLNTAGIGIARCSRDLRYLRANDTYATIAGLPLGDIIGRPIVEVMGEAAFATIRPYIERVLAGERVEYESMIPFPMGVESSYFRVVYVPDLDSDGSIIGWIACVSDITSRKQAETRIAERHAQLDLAGKVARSGRFTYDHATKKLQLSPGCAAIYGLPEDTQEMSSEDWRALVHPDDLRRLDTTFGRTFSKGETELVLEFRIVRHSEVRWIESRVRISYKEVGRLARMIGAEIDVTERKQAELALEASEAKFAGILAIAGDAIVSIDANYRITLFNDAAERLFGYARGEMIGQPMDLLIPTRFRAAHQQHIERFASGPDMPRRMAEHREVPGRRKNGEEFPIEASISKVKIGGEWVCTVVLRNITERKHAEERQHTLLAELDHRVKNALATVSSVVSHTRQGSRSVASFAEALSARIRSMASTHELLSSGRWQGISLAELVRCELAPYATRDNTEINGPDILLKSEAGQAMAMVLHELATNAAKYGALSTENGRVSIRWDRRTNGQSRSHLVFEWQEIGGPPVEAPGKPSYGTTTIRELIPYEFGGAVDLVLASDGVRCRVELPADWLSNDSEPVSEGKSLPTGAART
jgi:PAS domain S-box-containing protein